MNFGETLEVIGPKWLRTEAVIRDLGEPVYLHEAVRVYFLILDTTLTVYQGHTLVSIQLIVNL
jgi:hypothetical protein